MKGRAVRRRAVTRTAPRRAPQTPAWAARVLGRTCARVPAFDHQHAEQDRAFHRDEPHREDDEIPSLAAGETGCGPQRRLRFYSSSTPGTAARRVVRAAHTLGACRARCAAGRRGTVAPEQTTGLTRDSSPPLTAWRRRGPSGEHHRRSRCRQRLRAEACATGSNWWRVRSRPELTMRECAWDRLRHSSGDLIAKREIGVRSRGGPFDAASATRANARGLRRRDRPGPGHRLRLHCRRTGCSDLAMRRRRRESRWHEHPLAGSGGSMWVRRFGTAWRCASPRAAVLSDLSRWRNGFRATVLDWCCAAASEQDGSRRSGRIRPREGLCYRAATEVTARPRRSTGPGCCR